MDNEGYTLEFRSVLPARRVKNGKWTPVASLQNSTFFIEPYQRGYRWGEDNVEKLLHDLMSYSSRINEDFSLISSFLELGSTKTGSEEKYDFYCLQTLSVKKKKENEYELIDGQQRLTSLLLIYEMLSLYFSGWTREQSPYTLCYHRNGEDKVNLSEYIHKALELSISDFYDTKPPSAARALPPDEQKQWLFIFKQLLRKKLKIDNAPGSLQVDLVYIEKALNTILTFILAAHTEVDLELLFKTVKWNTLFIWYQVSGENPYDDFSSLNSNQIRLTNAELIKSLVLRKGNEDYSTRWEAIERGLNGEDFWAFISGEEKATRIDFVLELLAMRGIKDVEGVDAFRQSDSADEYALFGWYERLAQALEKSTEQPFSKIVLEGIEGVFDRISEWYDDVDVYHCIGLLTLCRELGLADKTTQEKLVKDLFDQYDDNNASKPDFILILKGKIKRTLQDKFKKIKKEDLACLEDLADDDALSYKDSAEQKFIQIILWMLNAWEVMESAENNTGTAKKRTDVINKRLPFSRVICPGQKRGWSLEHLMPQNPKVDSEKKTEEKTEEEKKAEEDYEALIADADANAMIPDSKNESRIHCLRNMALLTCPDNSSLGNGSLKDKTKKLTKLIIGEGHYIPEATLKAFLLYYNQYYGKAVTEEQQKIVPEETLDATYWTMFDSECYLKRIKECLRWFDCGGEKK